MLHAVKHPLSQKQLIKQEKQSLNLQNMLNNKKKHFGIDFMMNSSPHDFHPVVAPCDSFSPRALKSSDGKSFCKEIHFIAFTEFHQS